jgi:hypothetical protein
VVAIAKTRGRGAWSGLSLGLLAGIASVGVIWYVDTHRLTTMASAVVLASLIVAAAIVAGALIVRRAT